MKLICTIGSCLSANVAHRLTKHEGDWVRLSSVQHNRIDQFCAIHIEKKRKNLTLRDLGYELKPEFKHVNTIDNQIKGVGLGKSLPNKDDKIPLIDICEAIDFGKINLFIFDNYAELYFKIYEHKESRTPMFINEGYLTEKAERFRIINKLITEEELKEGYRKTFSEISKKNTNSKIVFIPFPSNTKNNDAVTKRNQEQIKAVTELKCEFKNLYILNEEVVRDNELIKASDPYHFNDDFYERVAQHMLQEIKTQRN